MTNKIEKLANLLTDYGIDTHAEKIAYAAGKANEWKIDFDASYRSKFIRSLTDYRNTFLFADINKLLVKVGFSKDLSDCPDWFTKKIQLVFLPLKDQWEFRFDNEMSDINYIYRNLLEESSFFEQFFSDDEVSDFQKNKIDFSDPATLKFIYEVLNLVFDLENNKIIQNELNSLWKSFWEIEGRSISTFKSNFSEERNVFFRYHIPLK